MPKISWPITDKLYLITIPQLKEIDKNRGRVKGTILDIGGPNPHIHRLIKDRIKNYYVVNTKKVECDYADNIAVSDASKLPFPDNSIDTVLCTQVLEHVAKPQKAINEIKRVLKPGGYCLLSTNMAWIYHPNPKDYYRFTRDGLKHLFREFKSTEVSALGGYVMALAELELLALAKIPVVGTVYAAIFNLVAPTLDSIFYSDKLTTNLLVVAGK